MGVCLQVQVPTETSGARFPEAGPTGGYEPPDVGVAGSYTLPSKSGARSQLLTHLSIPYRLPFNCILPTYG